MKKYWIEFSNTWKNVPMAYWVHKEIDGKAFFNALEFDPPAPKKEVNGKYKIYFVEYDGCIFKFSSLSQLNVFIAILSQKVLPRSIDLARQRTDSYGPNTHWLSKLPSKVKSWKYRENLIKYLKSIKTPLEKGMLL